jgi:hypothetical protein
MASSNTGQQGLRIPVRDTGWRIERGVERNRVFSSRFIIPYAGALSTRNIEI